MQAIPTVHTHTRPPLALDLPFDGAAQADNAIADSLKTEQTAWRLYSEPLAAALEQRARWLVDALRDMRQAEYGGTDADGRAWRVHVVL